MDVARPWPKRTRRISPVLVATLAVGVLVVAAAAVAYNELARVDALDVHFSSSHPALDGDHPAALGATVKNTGHFPLTITGASADRGAAVRVAVDPGGGSPSLIETMPLGVVRLEPGEHASLYVLTPVSGCTPAERRGANRIETINGVTLTYSRLGIARTARVGFGDAGLGIARGHNVECGVAGFAGP